MLSKYIIMHKWNILWCSKIVLIHQVQKAIVDLDLFLCQNATCISALCPHTILCTQLEKQFSVRKIAGKFDCKKLYKMINFKRPFIKKPHAHLHSFRVCFTVNFYCKEIKHDHSALLRSSLVWI